MKVTMYWSEHAILLALPVRHSLVPNSNITLKFLFQSCGSASIPVLYGITEVLTEVGVYTLG